MTPWLPSAQALMLTDADRGEGPPDKAETATFPQGGSSRAAGRPGPLTRSLPWKVLPPRGDPHDGCRGVSLAFRGRAGGPRPLRAGLRERPAAWPGGQRLTQTPKQHRAVVCLRWRLISRPGIATEISRNASLPDRHQG